MDWTTLPKVPSEQIFTHMDPESGKQTVFAVTRIREHVAEFGTHYLAQTPIDSKTAKMITIHRGLERNRMRRALKTKQYEPFIYLEMPDGTHLLADGSHTYVALFCKRQKWANAYVVPQSVWERFIVTGLPDWESESAMLNSFSGDPAND